MTRTTAAHDDNHVPTLTGVSSVDGVTIIPVAVDPSTGRVLVDSTGGFSNPMTTTGDIIYSSDNLGTPARLGVGSAGQVLGVSGGIPHWENTSAVFTFADSLVSTGGTVTLVNDSAAPTASQYYGTDAGSVLGYHNLPALSGFVPYSGATTDLDLGTHSLDVTNISGNSATTLLIQAATGASNTAGATLQIKGGHGTGSGAGGNTTLLGGQGGTTGAGGVLTVAGGYGGSVSGAGGALLLAGGTGSAGNANGGDLYIQEGVPNGSGTHGGIYLEQGTTGTNYTAQLILSSLTANRTLTLPNNSGTLALTSNIPALSVPVTIAQGGTGQTTKTAAFDALQPMTNAGDIIYGGASGSGTRLAIGTANQLLHGGASLPAWSAVVEADITLSAGSSVNNASATPHGFLPILSDNATQWLNGKGNWTTPTAAAPASYSSTTFTGTTTTITHNFNTLPAFACYDISGNYLVPETMTMTTTTAVVTFSVSSTYTIVLTVGSPQPQAVSVINSATYTTLSTDQILKVTYAGAVITLLTATGNTGREYIIDNNSTSNITVNTTSSQLIEGQTTQTIPPNSAMSVYCTGSTWRII